MGTWGTFIRTSIFQVGTLGTFIPAFIFQGEAPALSLVPNTDSLDTNVEVANREDAIAHPPQRLAQARALRAIPSIAERQRPSVCPRLSS